MQNVNGKKLLKTLAKNRYALILSAIWLIGVFILDFFTPLGLAVGVLYVLGLIFLVPAKSKKYALGGAVISTALTLFVLVYHLSPDDGWVIYLNRFISVAAIWGVTVFMISFIDSEQEHDRVLHERDERHMQMIASINDYAIVTLDLEGNIESWNSGAESLIGFTKDEIIGKNFALFFSEEDLEEEKPQMILDAAKAHDRTKYSGWHKTKNSRQFYSHTTINSIYNDDGEKIGYAKITRDLTDVRKAKSIEEQYTSKLENKNKELEQFAYIASHDLQEPLRTVLSFMALFEEEYGPNLDERGKKYVQFISKASARMKLLINGLLEYSRIGRNAQLSTIDLQEMLEDICDEKQIEIAEKNAEIVFHDLPKIYGYPDEFRDVMSELISNSLKFSKPDLRPYITITNNTVDAFWEFIVVDNGVGFLENQSERIFEIFQRLHPQEMYPGLGIGLAFCKKIVDMHGGEISAKSVPDGGAKIVVRIPKEINVFEEETQTASKKA